MNESTVCSFRSLLGGTVSLCATLGRTLALSVPAPAVRDKSGCFLVTKASSLKP